MGVTVRRATPAVDTWDALAGETRWVDYSAEQDGEDLVVYIHTFRRRRERSDSNHDVLIWKPATTGVARRYGAGEWAGVVRTEREWPPAELEYVPRRPRHAPLGRDRR